MPQTFALLAIFYHVTAGFLRARAAPTVVLDSATVTGINLGPTNKFLGIPFAEPPYVGKPTLTLHTSFSGTPIANAITLIQIKIGNLRFRLPGTLPPYNISFAATAYGPACPQQTVAQPFPPGIPAEALGYLTETVYSVVTPSAEDCLPLNVVTPADATIDSKLPVVVWFFPSGFEFGSTNTWDGGIIVEKAMSLGVPAVYVSMNYRLNAFGFLASQEVKDAGVGNLGLHDQRLALQWVQKYIGAFGGDPAKVTIWGESAGAISVALHMVANGGNPDGLFRAAFMQSGSPIPMDNPIMTLSLPRRVVLTRRTRCNSLDLAWMPRVDGVFLTADPQYLVQQGSVANIPFVNGDCDDEGTLYSFSTLNVTTDAQFEEYLQTYWTSRASTATVAQLMAYYPADPTQGSPFNTSYLNALTPQFKRMAAFLGDAVFQASRRFFLPNRSRKQNIWTYLSTRFKNTPFLGSFHTSDLANVYGGSDMASYLVRFVTNLDPNVGESVDLYWPQYDATTNQTMLGFLDGLATQALTTDTYRTKAIEYLMNVTLANPL